MKYDLVVRNGTIVDGTGWGRYQSDVGIMGGRIAKIGRIAAKGSKEIDAEGHFVTPGFIDNHTHLDAQICWDPIGPAATHGVTSAVMGNCGISVAPVRGADQREVFVMPALAIAEDIHRPTVEAAVGWQWESFAEYLDFISSCPMGINFVAQVGHGALRSYVLGERVFDKGAATEDDIAAMCRELESALEAGAFGFTSMLEGAALYSIYPDGTDTRDMDPRVVCAMASDRELDALTDVLASWGRGALQLESRWDLAVQMSAKTRLPLQFVFGCAPPRPDLTLDGFDAAASTGAQMIAAVPCRPQSSVVGFRARLPFDALPRWGELRARPLSEQRTALTDPESRAQLLDVARNGPYPSWQGLSARPPDWGRLSIIDRSVPPFRTVAEVAAQRNVDPLELFVDLSLDSDFHQLFSQPVTYDHGREGWAQILRHPRSLVSLADTGAHTAQAMDWTTPTFFLAYWVRQEQEFTWEQGVRMLTFDPASVYGGFGGRGVVREGFVADLNIFDPDTVGPDIPDADSELPGGGKRLTCKSVGIRATIVNGEVVFANGQYTGATPGRLLTGTGMRGTG